MLPNGIVGDAARQVGSIIVGRSLTVHATQIAHDGRGVVSGGRWGRVSSSVGGGGGCCWWWNNPRMVLALNGLAQRTIGGCLCIRCHCRWTRRRNSWRWQGWHRTCCVCGLQAVGTWSRRLLQGREEVGRFCSRPPCALVVTLGAEAVVALFPFREAWTARSVAVALVATCRVSRTCAAGWLGLTMPLRRAIIVNRRHG